VALNKEWVLWNLREAKEELDRTIAEIDATPGYDSGPFCVRLTEIYEHLNTAWNSREVSDAEARECSNDAGGGCPRMFFMTACSAASRRIPRRNCSAPPYWCSMFSAGSGLSKPRSRK
jgi:hypothetical protein